MLSMWIATLTIASNYATNDKRLQDIPEDFDCPMRQLALEFAMETQPFLAADKLQEIADALNGAKEAVNKSCVTVPTDWKLKETLPASWNDFDASAPSIFVDYYRGNDENDGSISSPLKHLDAAVAFARSKYGPHQFKQIILREGRHYLRKTIDITPQDNNLLISNFDAESVELSAAQPLNCDWKKEERIGRNEELYSCKVKHESITNILGLRVNGKRGIRARYPNGMVQIYTNTRLSVMRCVR